MTSRDIIKSTIVKSLETASNDEIGEAYMNIVGCCDCPYWSDCKIEHDCWGYITDKLDAEGGQNVNGAL